MSATVKKIVEYDDGTVVWTHDLPEGSHVQHLNLNAEFVGLVLGTTHLPYWLKSDGTITKKGP